MPDTVDMNARIFNFDNPETAVAYPDNQTVVLGVYYPEFNPDNVAAAAGLSLECCEGDPNAANIQFIIDSAIAAKLIGTAEDGEDFVQSNSLPVNHAHILWNYVLRITEAEDQKHIISLLDVGTHLSGNNAPRRNIFASNTIKNLGEPQVLKALLIFKNENEETETVELVPDVNGLKVAKLYTDDEIKDLAYGHAAISFRLKLIIARSYFQLSSIISLDVAPVSAKSQAIIDTILRGERPPGYDWAITVSESDTPGPTLYYVHKAAFASMSREFKTALETGRSLDDQIVMLAGENRCILPKMTAHEMKVVIPFVYGLPVPLPERWLRVYALGMAITSLFNEECIISVVFPQWERAIVRQAIALDKHSEDSFSSILSLLNIIFLAPYGAMPIAKRVAVGVMADMIHLRFENPYDVEGKEWTEIITLNENLSEFVSATSFYSILFSVHNHLSNVRRVQKIGLTEQQLECKVEIVNEC